MIHIYKYDMPKQTYRTRKYLRPMYLQIHIHTVHIRRGPDVSEKKTPGKCT